MSKLKNPKILIPAAVVIVLVGLALYIFLAPATWWKPFYVRLEMDEASAATAAQSDLPPDMVNQPAPTTVVTQPVSHLSTLPVVPPGWGIMYQLDPKVVNLADPGGLRYLQASVVLEFRPMIENYSQLEEEERHLAEEKFIETIDTRRPIIDDLVMTLLSSKTFNEIATIEGKQALKEALITAINEALGYQGVLNVYFTDFVVS